MVIVASGIAHGRVRTTTTTTTTMTMTKESRNMVYTCQHFPRYRREIFILALLRFYEDDTIISEDSR